MNFNEGGSALCTLYQHNDGYPSVCGANLKDALLKSKAREMGDLVLQVIAKMKTGPLDLYLVPAGTSDIWEAFTYDIYEKDGGVWVTCSRSRKGLIYDGPVAEWDTEIES